MTLALLLDSLSLRIDSVVELVQGKFGFDFRERNDVCEVLVYFYRESAIGTTSMKNDLGGVGLDEENRLERGDGQVGVEFFAEVNAAGRRGKNFGNESRVVEIGGISLNGATSDHGVWVVEASLGAEFDADLEVARKSAAICSGELGSQSTYEASGSGGMVSGSSVSGMNNSPQIFVLHFGNEFSSKVVYHCNQTLLFKGCHIRVIAGGIGLGKKVNRSVERALLGQLSRFGLA